MVRRSSSLAWPLVPISEREKSERETCVRRHLAFAPAQVPFFPAQPDWLLIVSACDAVRPPPLPTLRAGEPPLLPPRRAASPVPKAGGSFSTSTRPPLNLLLLLVVLVLLLLLHATV